MRNSNDEINFSHQLLLTDTQNSKIRKAFASFSSANIKLSKTQISKTVQMSFLRHTYFWKYHSERN